MSLSLLFQKRQFHCIKGSAANLLRTRTCFIVPQVAMYCYSNRLASKSNIKKVKKQLKSVNKNAKSGNQQQSNFNNIISTNLICVPSCPFCRIISGELPCVKIMETDLALAFLDIHPLAVGHALVIPKNHYTKMHEVAEESAQAVAHMLRRVGGLLPSEDYNVLQNNGAMAHQAVPHVHYHLIPKPNRIEGLGVYWEPMGQWDQESLRTVADQMQRRLSGDK